MKKYLFFKKVGVAFLYTVIGLALFVVLFILNCKKVSAKEVCIGECAISAYCPATNDPAGSRATSTGHTATANHTIAVDMYDPMCSYGAKVRIEGSDTIYTVEDCGNLLHYGRDFDVFFDTYSEMEQWGVRYKKVYLIVPDDKAKKKSKPKDDATAVSGSAVSGSVASGGASDLDEYWYENTAMNRAIEVSSIHTVNHGVVALDIVVQKIRLGESFEAEPSLMFDLYNERFATPVGLQPSAIN